MNRVPISKRLVMAGAVTGSLVTGGILGATVLAPSLANAATSSSSGSSTASPSAGATNPSMPAHGTPAHETAETAVTGQSASQAQAAAVKYVGSGTAGAVTTDFTKSGYEVTVTKPDGSTVEVHMDSSFNVMEGHGPGPGRPNDNDADDSGSGASPTG